MLQADKAIQRAKDLRETKEHIDFQLLQLRPRPVPRVVPKEVKLQHGPLLVDGTFYARRDKYSGRVIVTCPTCGHRL